MMIRSAPARSSESRSSASRDARIRWTTLDGFCASLANSAVRPLVQTVRSVHRRTTRNWGCGIGERRSAGPPRQANCRPQIGRRPGMGLAYLAPLRCGSCHVVGAISAEAPSARTHFRASPSPLQPSYAEVGPWATGRGHRGAGAGSRSSCIGGVIAISVRFPFASR